MCIGGVSDGCNANDGVHSEVKISVRENSTVSSLW